jgi:hypothetical protein
MRPELFIVIKDCQYRGSQAGCKSLKQKGTENGEDPVGSTAGANGRVSQETGFNRRYELAFSAYSADVAQARPISPFWPASSN